MAALISTNDRLSGETMSVFCGLAAYSRAKWQRSGPLVTNFANSILLVEQH